jgi:hypothetical protein
MIEVLYIMCENRWKPIKIASRKGRRGIRKSNRGVTVIKAH